MSDWKNMTDWSGLPDVYVTKAECQDGIVWRIDACSVPMAIGPEVRLVIAAQARADAAAAQAAMIERAAEQADPWDGPVTKNKIVDAQAIAAQQIKARIRALAPDAGTAELAKLRDAADGWRNEPESSEAWCAGNQYVLDRLCAVVGADPAKVAWDGSDGSLQEEADALIWRILRANDDDEGRPPEVAQMVADAEARRLKAHEKESENYAALERRLVNDDQARQMRQMRLETTSEHIARDMREGRFPEQSERQMVPVLTDLPDEIQVWRSMDALDHVGAWATTRYPEEAVAYISKASASEIISQHGEIARRNFLHLMELEAERDTLAASLAKANLRARNAYMRGMLDSAMHLRSTIPASPDNWEQVESLAQMLDAMASREAARQIAEGQGK